MIFEVKMISPSLAFMDDTVDIGYSFHVCTLKVKQITAYNNPVTPSVINIIIC